MAKKKTKATPAKKAVQKKKATSKARKSAGKKKAAAKKKPSAKKSTSKKKAARPPVAKKATKRPAAKKKKKTAIKKTGAKRASSRAKKALSSKRRPRPRDAESPSAALSIEAAGQARAHAEAPPQPPRRESASRRTPTPEAPRRAGTERHLPWSYGLDRVRALPVDPARLFVYWEVTDPAIENARERLGSAETDPQIALRLYDTTGRLFDGTNAHYHRDQDVERSARQWFFDVGRPGSEFFVELGVKTKDGRFQKIARSGRVAFPRVAAAEARPTEWMTVVAGARREPELAFGSAPGRGGAIEPPPDSSEPVRETHAEGGGETRLPEGREQVADGPWRVEVHATAGEREVSGQWTIYRSWVVTEGRAIDPGATPLFPGSSGRLGASERRFFAASELRLGGASERLRPGASERRLGGASERIASRSGYPPVEDERSD